MTTLADVAEMTQRLPGAVVSDDGLAFSVPVKGKLKGFAWAWRERYDPKKPKRQNPRVLAIRVRNLIEKELLIESDPVKFFTEPHYNGYAAVLVRLDAIEPNEFEELLIEAYNGIAPAELRK